MQSRNMNQTTGARSLLHFAILLGIGVFIAACTAFPFQVGTRDIVTLEYDFTDFDQVEIHDAFQVEIRQGDEYRVTVEVDEATERYLEVNQRGDTVEIGLRPRTISLFWIFNATQRAEITMPSLVGVTANDASRVDVSGFRTDAAVHFEVTDASTLEGEIDTGDAEMIVRDASRLHLEGTMGDVEIEASDASRVTLVGEGRNATIRASDASNVSLDDFAVQDAAIEARDASHVTVDASGILDIVAEDASSITYYGEPTMGSISSRDGSSLNQRQR